MAYVPPALRRKQEAAAKSNDAKYDYVQSHRFHHSVPLDNFLPHVTDIQNHFWPRATSNPEQASLGEVEGDCQEMAPQSHSTLNGSVESPDALKYILLFKDANPRWDQDGIIFAKTNLHLLPKHGGDRGREMRYQAKIDENHELQHPSIAPEIKADAETRAGLIQTGPILVFRQYKGRNSGFEFLGHFQISHLQFLEPNSEELVRMLEQKFTITGKSGKSRQYQRDPIAWKGSLSQEWAVLKMKKDEQADKDLDAPVIKVNNGNDRTRKSGHKQTKSVNELLHEMRFGQQPTPQTEAT